MSDHDPLCPFSDTFGAPCMYCALITRVRADERAQYQGRRDDMMRALSEELLHVRTKTLADLRASVEALPLVTVEGNHPYFGTVHVADVLALLDVRREQR